MPKDHPHQPSRSQHEIRGRPQEELPPPSKRSNIHKSPPKRRSSPSISIVDIRPAKKQRRLHHGDISLPYNDAQKFYEEEQAQRFFVYCPSDNTNLRHAKKRNFMDRVVYGMIGNRAVENMVPDVESKIPWTVPKVAVEFGRVDYVSERQEYSVWAKEGDGKVVDPKVLPSVEAMTAAEYEEAVERGDWRVAPDHAQT